MLIVARAAGDAEILEALKDACNLAACLFAGARQRAGADASDAGPYNRGCSTTPWRRVRNGPDTAVVAWGRIPAFARNDRAVVFAGEPPREVFFGARERHPSPGVRTCPGAPAAFRYGVKVQG